MNALLWTTGSLLLLYFLFGSPRRFSSSSIKEPHSTRDRDRRDGTGARTERIKVGAGTIALWVLVVSVILSAFGTYVEKLKYDEREEERKRSGQPQVALVTPVPPKPEQRFIVEALPDKETRIHVGLGMTCETDLVENNQKVWVRWGGAERFKDWKEGPNTGIKKYPGSNYLYLHSAETFPVKVEVHLYQTP